MTGKGIGLAAMTILSIMMVVSIVLVQHDAKAIADIFGHYANVVVVFIVAVAAKRNIADVFMQKYRLHGIISSAAVPEGPDGSAPRPPSS